MYRLPRAAFLISIILLAGLLAACEADRVAVGMRETNLPGQWQATYTTFSGTKVDTFRADAGQSLVLDYETEVDKGSLSIQVENPDDEVLWDVAFDEGGADTIRVDLNQDGRYAIVLKGEDAGGSWDLEWELE
jgi:NADPH:quinone reductase-like Zn-dependent oxidoreductase